MDRILVFIFLILFVVFVFFMKFSNKTNTTTKQIIKNFHFQLYIIIHTSNNYILKGHLKIQIINIPSYGS